MNLNDTESKAFSKSTIIAIPGLFDLTACSIVSCIFLVASLMNLPGIYAFWCGPRILFRTDFNLSAIMLLISLYRVLSKVRGRQFAE